MATIVGTILISTGAWYQVRTPAGVMRCQLSGRLRLQDNKWSNPVAVGDEVEVLPETATTAGSIVAVLPRRNALVRRSPLRPHLQRVMAANVDQALLLVSQGSLPEKLLLLLIDRFLVVAAQADISPLLVWNKIDSLSPEDRTAVEQLWTAYARLGYATAQVAALTGEGLPALQQQLNGKRTVIAGPSGVGKSTLLNALVPEATQRMAEVAANQRGCHTTRFACMFETATLALIDTPGVQSLLSDPVLPHNLGQYFPEIKARLGGCKYYNCRHLQEPHCAVRRAVEEGEIAPNRYKNYCTLL